MDTLCREGDRTGCTLGEKKKKRKRWKVRAGREGKEEEKKKRKEKNKIKGTASVVAKPNFMGWMGTGRPCRPHLSHLGAILSP